MKYVAVKNFEKHQHYKGRTPPWIKLYNDILDDYAFLSLPEATQRHLMLIWLIASRHHNRIPNDAGYIARAIHAQSKVNLPAILASGWLYETDEPPAENASKIASKSGTKHPQNAPPEVEEEIEAEKEEDSTHPVEQLREMFPRVSECLPPDPSRTAAYADPLLELMKRVKVPLPYVAEMDSALDGIRGYSLTPAEVRTAVIDFLANNATPNMKLFRRYLQEAREKPRSTANGNGHRMTPGEQTKANLRAALGGAR